MFSAVETTVFATKKILFASDNIFSATKNIFSVAEKVFDEDQTVEAAPVLRVILVLGYTLCTYSGS